MIVSMAVLRMPDKSECVAFRWSDACVVKAAAVQDVAYLLWTSVEPSVVAAEEAPLLAFYLARLRTEVARACGAPAAAALPDDVAARALYDVRACLFCVLQQ